MTITEQLKLAVKASAKASPEKQVDALISAGILKPSDRTKAIQRLLNRKSKKATSKNRGT